MAARPMLRASASPPPPRKETQGGGTNGGVVSCKSRGGSKEVGLRSSGCRRTTMSSLGTSKGILEIAKFGVYVSVPVALTYLVATDSKTLKKLMGLCPYVVYLPEGPRPPPPEELRERAREIARMDGGFSRHLCPGNNADDESISHELV